MTAVLLDLPGPSRRVVIEPLQVPQPAPRREEPPPAREPAPPPREPAREEPAEPVPA